ncbi:hypothetical protein FOCC_FOCC013871 [Frankliniella occidentalis]|nr:hypothetical protein FOCC_FOCC013871 [Frankliniella occidentalis]
MSRETKRLRSKAIQSDNCASSLIHAASQKLKKDGDKDSAAVLQMILKDPAATSANILALLKDASKEENKSPTPLNAEEVVSNILDANLSKSQYLSLRSCCKAHNVDIFPSYHTVVEAKTGIYPTPSSMIISESSAEIDLQSLLDHDTKRLFKYLEAESSECLKAIPDGAELLFLHKWGFDGSGSHTTYQQHDVMGQGKKKSIDVSILLTAIAPLELRLPGEEPTVLWSNPSPGSVRFCKPIRVQFSQENKEVAKKEKSYFQNKINALRASQVETLGKTVTVRHKLEITMLDGKTRSYLTDTPSFASCPVCGGRPVQLKTSISLPIKEGAYSYGLSPLHARIRFLEAVLHISYRLIVKQWSVNEAVIADRKREIQARVEEEMGIIVDVVKRGSGNTNCGNTSRIFFSDPRKASEATGFDLALLERFAIILDAINCGLKINSERFREFAWDTAVLFENLYPWYHMPSSVHVILMHGADIMRTFELPIGVYTEEALEARNKNIRNFREHRTRKISGKHTMEDLFKRLLLTGDIYLSSLKAKTHNKMINRDGRISFLLE